MACGQSPPPASSRVPPCPPPLARPLQCIRESLAKRRVPSRLGARGWLGGHLATEQHGKPVWKPALRRGTTSTRPFSPAASTRSGARTRWSAVSESQLHFGRTQKRQRTAALQDASHFLAHRWARQRLGVRLSSAAFERNCICNEPASVLTTDTLGCARCNPFGEGILQHQFGAAIRERRKRRKRRQPPFS